MTQVAEDRPAAERGPGAAAVTPQTGEIRWYLAGRGLYFTATGIMSVLYAWLVTNELQSPPDKVGLAQMIGMLPILVFIMIGGVIADRNDCRVLLARLGAIFAVGPLALAIVYGTGNLNYPILVLFGFAMGSMGAFVMPARDSLLSHVGRADIQHTVKAGVLFEFGSQLVGYALAGLAMIIGAVPILAVQSALLVTSGVANLKISPAPPLARAAPSSPLRDVIEGFRIVIQLPALWPVIVYMFVTGVIFIGYFMVGFPILVRDVYGGDSLMLAGVTASFMAGVGIVSYTLMRYGHVRRPGRAMLLANLFSTSLFAVLTFGLPYWGTIAFVFGWGLISGISMTMGRAIVQEAAPDSHRARVLAVYQIGFIGGGPLGALLMGYVIGAVGPLDAVLFPVATMAVVWLAFVLFTPIWGLEPSKVQKTAAL